MTECLNVRLFDGHAGSLSVEGDIRAPEDWRFVYDPDYLGSTRPVALSVSLPLRAEPFEGAVVRNWFANLLPEGLVRQAIAERLRLSMWDDFALLAAIGGECAGAVSITPLADRAPAPSDAPMDLAGILAGQAGETGAAELALIGTPRRLSLAGAQDKIAVVLAAEGTIRLPAIGEVTTHILKPDSLAIRGLRDLEALGLTLARAIGLPVAHAMLTTIADHRALLVERYDRDRDEAGALVRLHQEDFCQALGYPGEHKYEALGGPSLATCSRLIRQQLRLGPTAIQAFLDWAIYNVLIGNADAHAKNLALLCRPDGTRELAPFYDLVPTIAVARSMVNRQPALRIGTAASIDRVSAEDWRTFAEETGYRAKFVRDRIRALARKVVAQLDDVVELLEADGGDAQRLVKGAAAIGANVERTTEAIAAI